MVSDQAASEREPRKKRAGRSFLGPLGFTEFRRLFLSVVVTQLGDWLHVAALGWYVLEQGGNAAQVTSVAAAGIFPQLLLTLAGGIAADRWARRRVLRTVALAQFVVATAFAVLVALDLLGITLLVLFAFVLGSGAAIWQPIYLAYLGDLLPRDQLEGATGLSMGALYTARTVGPALAGGLIAVAGTGAAFFLNAASFLAPLLALQFIKVRGLPSPAPKGVFALVEKGVRAVARDEVLGPLWLLTAAASLLALPVFALIPVFVMDVFDAGALTLGALLSAAGLGQLLGSAALALGRFALSRIRWSGLLQLIGHLMMGALVVGFAISDAPITASLALFGFNFVYGFLTPRANAIVSSRTRSQRGTAQALFLLVFGLVPLGQVAIGWAALWLGTVPATAIAGIALAVVAVLGVLRAKGLREYQVRVVPMEEG